MIWYNEKKESDDMGSSVKKDAYVIDQETRSKISGRYKRITAAVNIHVITTV